MKKCAKCGAEYEANFCPNCGMPADGGAPLAETIPPDQNEPDEKKKKTGGKKKGCLISSLVVVGLLLVLLILAAVFGGNSGRSDADRSETTTEWQTTRTVDAETAAAAILLEETTVPQTTAKPETAGSSAAGSTAGKAPPTNAAADAGPKTQSTAQPHSSSGLSVEGITSPIGRNEPATLTVKGEPNTEYTIKVYYSTAVSQADGLEKHRSNGSGIVSWTWKIGGKTAPGKHKIVISGGGQQIETFIETTP